MIRGISLRRSADGIICTKCGDALIAPEWSYDFIEEGIFINLWFCMSCGNQFETEAFAIDTPDNRAFEESFSSAA